MAALLCLQVEEQVQTLHFQAPLSDVHHSATNIKQLYRIDHSSMLNLLSKLSQMSLACGQTVINNVITKCTQEQNYSQSHDQPLNHLGRVKPTQINLKSHMNSCLDADSPITTTQLSTHLVRSNTMMAAILCTHIHGHERERKKHLDNSQ